MLALSVAVRLTLAIAILVIGLASVFYVAWKWERGSEARQRLKQLPRNRRILINSAAIRGDRLEDPQERAILVQVCRERIAHPFRQIGPIVLSQAVVFLGLSLGSGRTRPFLIGPLVAGALLYPMLRSAARRALENNTGSDVPRHRIHPLVYVPYVVGVGFVGLSVWFAISLQRWWPLIAVAPLVIIAAVPELLRRRADRGPGALAGNDGEA